MKEKDKKNAIVLTRVSTLQQELESQTEKVMNAAIADGYANPIVIEHKESAVKNSAGQLAGIQEMQQYIETGNIAVVYISELSRLTRRPKDLFEIRDYLIERQVQLVCLNPYFKLLNDEGGMDPTANIVLSLYSAINEQECALRSERCVRGKLKKKAEGKFVGGKELFGYGRDKDDYFTIKPEEAKVVKRVYNMFVNGKNRLAIARELRTEGYLQNFMSDVASHSHVDDMLRNADYTGKSGKPAIISEALFDKVQEILHSKKAPLRRKVSRIALCRGIMFNPKSQSHIKKYYVRGNDNSYYCLLDETTERKKFVHIPDIDKVVWGVIKKVYVEQRDGRAAEQEKKIQRQRAANLNRKITHLEVQLSSNQRKREICAEKEIMQQISAAKAKEMLKKIDAMEAQQKKDIEEMRRELEQLQANSFKVEDIDTLDGEQREELVARLVHHIDLVPLSDAKCVSKWRYSIYFKRGDVHFGYLVSGRQARP